MTFDEKLDVIEKLNPQARFPVDCDGGLIGYATDLDGFTVAVYSAEDTVEYLRDAFDDGEDNDEAFASALDWFEYNTLGSIVPNAPIYVEGLGDDEDENAFTWQLMTLPYDGTSFRQLQDLKFTFFDEENRAPVTHSID